MSAVIEVTREKRYRSPLWNTAGPTWKWIYYLPSRETTMPDGRIATVQPGGFSTKAEIADLARRIYPERPLTLRFPDGTTKEMKR